MRRKTLLMTLLMLIGFSMANAVEVEVGTMETNKLTNQFPTNPFFSYSLSQQIYTAGEMGGTAGSITSISFYRDWTSETIDELKMSGLKLYLMTTSKTQFDSETDMVPFTEADLVWSGTLSAPTVDYKGWVTINLDKPYEIDGFGNIVVCFYDTNPSKTANNTNKFYYNATSGNTSLTYFSNDVAPDLENLSEYAGNKLTMSAHNWVKFQIGNYSKVEVTDQTTNWQFPTYTNYNYSLSQQIYTTEEVGSPKTLNSISFRNIGDEKTRDINLYLVQTDKTQFDADDDFINFTNANMVFSGEVTFINTDWTTIEFDIPFNYSGVQNLAVIMVDNSNHYEGSAAFLAYSAVNQSIMSYTDTEPLTLSNFTTYAYYRGVQKNKVRFNEGNATGEQSNMELPIFPSLYQYSLSQQIYTNSELGFSANSIASISFYNSGEDEALRYLDVYLKHTTKSQFADGSDGETVSESDKVFSGYVTFKPGEWTAIRFDEYFEYNGGDNLVVIVNDRTGKYSDPNVKWLVKDCSSQCLHICTDDSEYDPSSVYSCALRDLKNQILINDKGLSFKPTNVNISDIVWNGATISWEGRGSKWNLRYKTDGAEDWTLIEGITDTQYLLTGLEQETRYYIGVQGDDNGDLSDWSYQISFWTSEQYPKPSDLEIMEATPFSAIVKWTENSSATAWEIEAYYSYGTETKFTTEAGSNPFVLTGLHPGVIYNIYVRSVIDAENGIYSNWSSKLTFTTPEANPAPNIMAVEPIPGGANISWEGESDRYIVRYRKPTPPPTVFYYTEDFESITTEGDLPEGWTAVDADGDGFNWSSLLLGLKCHSGTACLYSESYDNYGGTPLFPDNWLITPQLELKGTLSAWLVGQDSSWPYEHFAIYVSTAGTDIADFVEVLPEQITVGNYREYTVDLSSYAGQQGYIAFRHFNVTDMFKLNLDDVSIYETVEPYPWVTAETTDKTFTISGLEYDADYEVEVLGVMKGLSNSSSGLYPFTTLCKHPAPFDIVVNPLGTTADVEWTGYSEMYEVKYRSVQEVVSFSDDFESGDLTTKGWTVYTDNEFVPGRDGWEADTYFSSSGSYSAISYSWTNGDGALNADNWLITPLVDLNGILAYWEWANDTYRDSYEVLLSTTGNAETDFTEVLRPFGPSEAANEWIRTQIDLSAYAGQQGYIAFHHKDYDKTRILIDDIKIYQLSYGTTVTKYVTKPEIALKDLTPGTQYEIRVIGQMSGEAEAPSEPVIFTTGASDPIEVKFDNYADNTGDISANIGVLANVTIENLAFPDGQWVPVCLPFDLDVADSPFTEARVLGSYEMAGSTMIVDFTTPTSYMYAGHPYLVKVVRGDGGNLVDPVFKAVTISGAYNYYVYDYLYFYNANYYQLTCTMDYPTYFHVTDNGRKLESLYDTCILQAFEPYFYFGGDLSSFNEILLNTGDNDYVTGLNSIKGETGNDIIYNVAGQRLGKMQKGINIVNGKKVLVK